MVKKGVPLTSIKDVNQVAYLTDIVPDSKKWNTVSLSSHEECLQDKIKYAANFKIVEVESNKWQANRITQDVKGKLICASIMSKKMAEGIQGLVLDVKWGSGAFMKTLDAASELPDGLCSIGGAGGKRVVAFVTDMNQPLGRFIGNSLEVEECLAILKREGLRGRPLSDFADCENLSVDLAGAMIWIGGKATSLDAGRTLARELLDSGAALKKFEDLVKAQGGDLSKLPMAKMAREVRATKSGYLNSMNCEQIGYAGLVMGAGRMLSTDVIDATAGIEMCVRLGDRIEPGTTLFKLYGTRGLDEAERRILESLVIQSERSKSLATSNSNDLISLTKGIES